MVENRKENTTPKIQDKTLFEYLQWRNETARTDFIQVTIYLTILLLVIGIIIFLFYVAGIIPQTTVIKDCTTRLIQQGLIG